MLWPLLDELLKEQGEYRIYILLWSNWHPWAIFKKFDFCFCKNNDGHNPVASHLLGAVCTMELKLWLIFFLVFRKFLNSFWTIQKKKSTGKTESRSINSKNWQSNPTEFFWYCPDYSPEICTFKLPLAKEQMCQWLRYFVKNSHHKCCHQLQTYLWPRSSKSHAPQMELEFKYSFQAFLFNLIRCLLTQPSCISEFQSQVSEQMSAQQTHLPAQSSQTSCGQVRKTWTLSGQNSPVVLNSGKSARKETKEI